MDDTQASHGLVDDGAFLIGGMGGAHHEDAFEAVDGLTGPVLQNHVLVAGVLDAPRDLVQRPVPVLFLPCVAVGRAVQGFCQTVFAGVHGKEGRALGAQRPLVDRMIGIALGGNELAVAHVGDDLTAYRAERTDRHHFLGALDLQLAGIGHGIVKIDSQLPKAEGQHPRPGQFQETPPRTVHGSSP